MKYVGKSAVFAGYDGRFYDATIISYRRGKYVIQYQIRQPLGAMAPCQAILSTAQAKERLVVQL